MNKEEVLQIVKDGFEEQKGIKILSLFFANDNTIQGFYIIPPQQSLSFSMCPPLDMATNFGDYGIYLDELGQALTLSYQGGWLKMFDNLLHDSDIKIENKSFINLVNTCRNNPPLLLFKKVFMEWIKTTNEYSENTVKIFLEHCEAYSHLDTLHYDKDLLSSNSASINNCFNDVYQQLSEKKYKKVTELAISQIDKLLIKLQLDLYTTDDI